MNSWKKILVVLVLSAITLPMMAIEGVSEDSVYIRSKFYVQPQEYQEVCSNQLPFQWRVKHYLSATGTYTDTVSSRRVQNDTVYIVDSIRTLNLTVHNTMINRTLELRYGSKVQIRGIWYNQPGTYYDTIPSSTGCDSILHLTIVWAEHYRQIDSMAICYGNSASWHGQTLTEEGVYWDSLKTTAGYDSVFQLYLHVHYPFAYHKDTIISESDTTTFFWRGMHIAYSGDYRRTYVDQYGCDSTYHLHLTVAPSSEDTTITQYFCRNQGFIWRSTYYYEQMIFVDSLKNMAGGDSIIFHAFIPRDNDFHSDRVNHYEGEPIEWRGKSYVIDSIYQDTLVNQYGCDSIMELRLVRKYDLDRNIVRCKGDTAMFHKEIIEQNCHRNDTLLSILGGDSIIHYHFSFASSFYSREFITICSNEYFPWTGHYIDDSTLMVLHEEGQYYDRHRNEAGCDSTYEIVVKHSPAYIKDSVVLICKDTNEMVSPVIWYDSKGTKYEFYPYQYLDTIIRDTMRHTLPREPHEAISSVDFVPITGGCDSIFNFHLIITDRCSELDSIPMCTDEKGQNIPVIVDGRTYDEPGLYSNKMPSSMHQELLMKDSTHTFRIWLAPKDTSYDTVRWCESRLPVTYNNGQKFYKTSSDDYTIHFFNRYGCDSLVYLHIDIVPTVYSPIQVYDQFCPGDTIYVKTPTGKIFRQAGEFNDTVPYGVEYEWEGCDSIIRYRIEYKQAFFHTETHYLGVDSAYKWLKHFNDTILTKAGVYYDSCKNQFDCDSVYQLRLIYAQPFYSYETKHLCTNQLPYIWHDKSINQPGTYFDSLYTVYKLDSVYQLHVTIDSVFHDTIVKNFCYGDYFELSGKKITIPGNYSITLQSEDACDSVITYVVNFISTTVSAPEVRYIAQGSSYLWRGKTLTKTGFYTDTLRTTKPLDGGHACDSLIYAIQLYVVSPFYKEETASVCSNQLPLIWHGQSINTPGEYWDRALSVHQIDSVYKLTVTVNPATTQSVYHHLCEGDAYQWHGKYYVSSGVYPDTLSSQCGCDSIVQHIVSFTTATTTSQQTLQCAEGESVMWRGKPYSVEGLYFDTLRNQWGCDSIRYSMRLIVEHPFFYFDSVTICTNEFPYKWHNKDLMSAGVHWDSCRTKYGLDSIYKLRIDTLPSSFYSFTHIMCPGSSYHFGSQLITQPGVYVDHQFKSNGCDSTIRCIVNHAPKYFYDEVITYVNDSELPISWHGKELDHEDYYFDSLTTKTYGCDSIHRVYLKKSKSYFFTEEKELCDNLLPLTWHGQTIYSEGTYTDPHTTQYGLDSIYQLTLIVNPTERSVLNEQICQGESYQLYGKTYNKPGIYHDSLATEEGCYHFVELRLNMYNTLRTDIHHNVCPGDTVYINGQAITQSGTYEETTKSLVTSCDSVIRHIVGYRTAFYRNESKVINPGDSYMWHKDGQPWLLTQSGTYFDSCKNQFGCDSIYRLELKVNQLEYHFNTEVVTICESALPYDWHGTSYYNDTLVQAKYKTKLGRDSIYTLDLHVSRAKDSVVWLNYCDGGQHVFKGKIYTRSVQLTDTITDSHGCDSVRIHYTINFYPRYSLTQLVELKNGECFHFGEGTPLDTTICTSGIYYRHFTTVNGCDSLVTLKVSACANDKETLIRKDLCEGESIFLGGQEITQSGRYYSYLKTADGCDSIVIYAVNIHPSYKGYTSASICRGDTYRWTGHYNDTVLTKAGTYIDSVPTASGCYDIYTLQLNYKSQNWTDTVISLCADKTPYVHKDGRKFYSDTILYDTLGINIQGCDSILRWHIEINQHCSPYDHYTRCTNETKYIAGLLISQQGVYSVHRLTAEGKDSIYRFIVRDVTPYERSTILEPACDALVYNGKTFLARGPGKETFQVDFMHRSAEGCDSIEHVTMTINSSSPKYTEYATIADYETYRFEGKEYKLAGTYPVPYLNSHLCDSIRELVLTVLTTVRQDTLYFNYCRGDQSGLEIFGKRYYPVGNTVIYDTIRPSGAPIIRTAFVYEHLPFVISGFDPHSDQMICAANKVAFEVSYSVPSNSGLPEYYDVDFMVGDLDVHPKQATYPVNGKTVLPIEMDGLGTSVAPGYYSYRIKFRSTACAYSDTAFTGNILVRYPAEVMQANWGNMVNLTEADYNAGHWTFMPPYAWQVWDDAGRDKTSMVIPSDIAQPYLASNNLRSGDLIIATLYRTDYPTPIPTCPFTFQAAQSNPYENPILVYPTAVAKSTQVHIETEQQGTYQLYNATGNACQSGALDQGDNHVLVPGTDGCYLLKMTLRDGTSATERVIVY